MRRLLKGVALSMLLGAALSGCESSDCMLSSESYCGISFVNAEGKGIKLLDTLTVSVNLNDYDTSYVYRCDTDTVIAQRPVDSLEVKGYERSLLINRVQGILLNRKSGADKVEIPLSFAAERDTFFFRYSARLSDTLWVEHQNLPYFSSMECGTVMHYKIVGITSTTHLIDSVQVVTPEVTNMLRENVKIYFTVSH